MPLPPPTERQARLIWLALSGLALATLVGLVAGLIWGLAQALRILSPVLWPLAVGGVLAYLLDPVVDFLERQKVRRSRAIVSVFVLALLLLGAFFGSIVPQLVTETRQLAARVPDYSARLERRLEHWVANPPPLIRRWLEKNPEAAGPVDLTTATDMSGHLSATNAEPLLATNSPPRLAGSFDQKTLATATGWLAEVLPRIGSWLADQVSRLASWFGVLAGLVLVPVYCFYFLLEKRAISSKWTDYLPVVDSRFKNELVFVLNSINNYLIAFFRGQVLVAISDGVLYGLGFLVVGVPYALLLGVAAMFLTMIPYLGAMVICLTALLLSFVSYGDWAHPLEVLAVFGCVQALEGLFISPRIMGGRVGLHPVSIIIAVMVGTTLLGGLLGGILAIPLTAALRVVMSRYIWKRTGPEGEGF